jgi:hypothetical protein
MLGKSSINSYFIRLDNDGTKWKSPPTERESVMNTLANYHTFAFASVVGIAFFTAGPAYPWMATLPRALAYQRKGNQEEPLDEVEGWLWLRYRSWQWLDTQRDRPRSFQRKGFRMHSVLKVDH